MVTETFLLRLSQVPVESLRGSNSSSNSRRGQRRSDPRTPPVTGRRNRDRLRGDLSLERVVRRIDLKGVRLFDLVYEGSCTAAELRGPGLAEP